MRKVLIAGASGYLGAQLCLHLARHGCAVTALDKHEPEDHELWIQHGIGSISCDILNAATIQELGRRDYDIAVHLISLDHRASEGDLELVTATNVLSTWKLLEVLSKRGLARFVYFSTAQVYGAMTTGLVSEAQRPMPMNTYALTHYLSEEICHYFTARGLTRCVAVRLANSYGPPVFARTDCWWVAVNNLCRSAYEKHEIRLHTDGSPQRDFIHGSDVCRALAQLIDCEDSQIECRTFNLATGRAHSLLEVAHVVKEVYWKRYQRDISIRLPDGSEAEEPSSFAKATGFAIDTSRMRSLGFECRTSLEEGIHTVFQYLEKHFPIEVSPGEKSS